MITIRRVTLLIIIQIMTQILALLDLFESMYVT